MIWRIALGAAGFWLSFYALSFTPISLNPNAIGFAWWAIPYAMTFGALALASLVLIIHGICYRDIHRGWSDAQLLAWLLSRVT